MSILSNSILAFSMSADAFAAAISKGVALRKPKLLQAIKIGAIFGIVETITPIIGWLLGTITNQFIESFDHWVAFAILLIIGGKMIFEGLQKENYESTKSHKLYILILTAIGTSIDALAVGVTLAIIEANIWLISIMIGFATFIMASIGIMAGSYIGQRAGKAAEVIGGLCLIAIGTKILLEHLGIIN